MLFCQGSIKIYVDKFLASFDPPGLTWVDFYLSLKFMVDISTATSPLKKLFSKPISNVNNFGNFENCEFSSKNSVNTYKNFDPFKPNIHQNYKIAVPQTKTMNLLNTESFENFNNNASKKLINKPLLQTSTTQNILHLKTYS